MPADGLVTRNDIGLQSTILGRMINGLGITLGEEDVGLAATTLGEIMNESGKAMPAGAARPAERGVAHSARKRR